MSPTDGLIGFNKLHHAYQERRRFVLWFRGLEKDLSDLVMGRGWSAPMVAITENTISPSLVLCFDLTMPRHEGGVILGGV
jgi:hypothetical protein